DIDGVKYAVSSQWRPVTDSDDSRTPFVNWIIEQLQKVKFETGYENSFARNRILFGAPGTGKSFKLNKDRVDLLEADADKNYERVTFHPDYSYANFVGTYKPVPIKDEDDKDSITYEYVPGPFMRVYVNALKSGKTANPKPHLLIIEEINRANVAAVFGDVFQLLDRVKNVSEYPIMPSQDMKEYLAKPEVLGGSPADYNIIKIPDNMFIWATMNSADQGVFPMDTAFKRRWDFSYLGIDDAVEEMSDTIKNKKYTLGTGANARLVNWNDLRSAINDVLSSESYNINEDKLLGPYFISKSILESEDEKEFIKVFKNKVLMYLFDDAAKQKRKTFFEKCKDEVKGVRYSDLCNQFDAKGVFIFPEEVSKRFTEKPTTEQVAEANEE
ncbi:MAG: AAA family ATPase, partial [Longicatena sp.]